MKKKILLFILLILWMGVIFYFSSQESDVSTYNSRTIISKTKLVSDSDNEEKIITTDIYFRKACHACVYLVLSIIACFLVNEYSLNIKKIIFIAFLICFLYSCSDEIHQMYVSGRSAEFRDIIIDNTGALFGYVMFYLFKGKKLKS